MLVIAKVLGEHPQGQWRQPGEQFEFNGKTPGSWMEPVDKKAQAKADKAAAAAAQADADADAAAAAIDAAKLLAADPDADPLAPPPPEPAPVATDTPKATAIHRGAGKWDVFGADKEIVEGGGDLDKEGAKALAEKLNA